MSLVWYIAFASILTDGTALIDVHGIPSRDTCEHFMMQWASSPLDVSRSGKPPKTPYTLTSECAPFTSPPTVVMSGDRLRLRLKP